MVGMKVTGAVNRTVSNSFSPATDGRSHKFPDSLGYGVPFCHLRIQNATMPWRSR